MSEGRGAGALEDLDNIQTTVLFNTNNVFKGKS